MPDRRDLAINAQDDVMRQPAMAGNAAFMSASAVCFARPVSSAMAQPRPRSVAALQCRGYEDSQQHVGSVQLAAGPVVHCFLNLGCWNLLKNIGFTLVFGKNIWRRT